jgi:hypothetical protein
MPGVNYIDYKSIDYAEARTNILAGMQKSYVDGDLFRGINKEVLIVNDNKLGMVKLGFKELRGKFSNGVRKIKNLYAHYETVGKRHLH